MRMSKNKFGKREKKNKLDKFYTNPEVAYALTQKTFEFYDPSAYDTILEPSAGSGAFLLHFPDDKRIGLDLEPDHPEIKESDFFEWTADPEKSYLVIGNPPFGRVSSLAVKFFNHSAEFADVIAFLIPRTFRRVSVQNRLDLNFHLVYDEEIPVDPCCFEPKMSAKCCFQIWEKRDYKREKVALPKRSKDWEFLSLGPLDENNQPTPPLGASFAIKAYGSNCGNIVTEDLEQLRPKSWHWIKTSNPEKLIKRFNELDYSISKDTARQDSLGRAELVWIYNQVFGDSI
tara:strand:+ start:371 stop:1231 length:861 start_codon:yes stop_codon:yes gene_type:complete